MAGCTSDGHFRFAGYTTEPNYDPSIHTVYVPMAQNVTFRRGLEDAVVAAKGSVGGALVAAKSLGAAGLAIPAHDLVTAAIGAFLHSLSGALRVAGGVALGGAIMAAALLPARPRVTEALALEDLAELESAVATNGNGSGPELVPVPISHEADASRVRSADV